MNVLDTTPEEALAFLRGRGLDGITARRALTGLVREGAEAIGRVPGLSPARAAEVALAVERPRLEIRDRRVDPRDGFVKYLFATRDGLLVEAVRIPLLGGKFTVCLSSEAGCAMGCTFCATARMGLVRRLEAWEIAAQLVAVRDEAPGRVTGAVFMGMGEPLDNYDAVARACAVLEDQGGLAIAKRAVTISTVGLVPGIDRFAAEGRRERLAFSLVTAIEEKRRALVPLARRYDLAAVRGALERVLAGPGKQRRILVALVLIAGVTTTEEDARAAVAFLRDLPCWIDLIDVNDAGGGLARPAEEERSRFIAALREAGHPIQVRYSGGQTIEAGCGMLAATRAGGREAAPIAGILPHPREGAGPVPG
jgi:23S rRNA (adenine2503-C2)-methyltransferase